MKRCQSCGANVPEEAKFCQSCGSSQFVFDNPTPTGNFYNYPYQPAQNQNTSNQFYNQQPVNSQPEYQQSWQQNIPVTQPKNKKTGLIIGIVAAVLIVLAAIGMISEKVLQDQGYGYYNEDVDFDYDFTTSESLISSNVNTAKDDVEYTKGSFDGTTYVNKWADIEFSLPKGFSNADLATYSAAENSTTECGMYFMADDTMGLIYICYEKLPTFPVYDEEEYLDAALKTLKNISGVTYELPDTYTTAVVGGYSFKKAECKFNNGNGDFINSFYVRKLDNYMIVISAIGVNSGYNDDLVANITTAK